MNELIEKLSQGEHEVVFRPVRDEGLRELREAIEREYVHVHFVGTRGGTELGVPLDAEYTDLSGGDLDAGTGEIRVGGDLNLDGVPVRCRATLDLGTLKGRGGLEVLTDG
jgi:hypothetical protein